MGFITDTDTIFILQGLCFVLLTGWQFLAKYVARNGSALLVSILLLEELLVASISALIRMFNIFLPGVSLVLIPYQLYGVILHYIITLIFTWIYNPKCRKRAILLLSSCYAPTISILLTFSAYQGFVLGPQIFLTVTIVVLVNCLWGTISFFVIMPGFCDI
jgi:hypothetical protein